MIQNLLLVAFVLGTIGTGIGMIYIAIQRKRIEFLIELVKDLTIDND